MSRMFTMGLAAGLLGGLSLSLFVLGAWAKKRG